MNFTYLSSFPRFKKLYEYCSEAEEFAISKPNISAASARKAMEFIVKMIYSAEIDDSYGLTVFEMITDVRFCDFIGDQTLINSIHYIRKMGNVAAHDAALTADDAISTLDELHFLVGEYCIMLGIIKDYPKFVDPTDKPATKTEVAKAEEAIKEKVEVPQELIAEFATRMRDTRFNVQHGRDEEENKKLYLKASLREAGWAMVNRANQAMPGAAGLNMILDDGDTVDWILYGRDNRPLAVIEYTTTNQNIVEGRTKAIEKANKLAQKCGYKPIAYYTNGYHIYVIDQLGYRPRRVFQFHTIEELELLKLRASIRLDISDPQIDDNITNRDYQKQAIKAACSAFNQKRRHSLLVMATGTGKTRVSISLVDILMKANWVKNILFLADRTSLVRQAHKNFNKLLPNITTSVYSGGSLNRDSNARIIFSTYQTMINLINDDTREFGIGRFDLIIIDEAHRSIFKKYGALFHYFDALMVGLTATPRCEENKNTYQMFELPNGEPDFAYELEQAIDDGYLVGFDVCDKTPSVLRRTAFFDELTEAEKEVAYDLGSEYDIYPEDNIIFTEGWLKGGYWQNRMRAVNINTIDAMLNELMKNGLKIESGDKIGKTIIFASSHFEAEKIVERFNYLYSHLSNSFCKLIDSSVENSLSLIDSFGERDKMPQIAVSVDMMDTGIDVPDVLNLVFFKSVYSKIKFLQMIGRGTRLCDNVYGPEMHKKGFLIFDYNDNFRFFSIGNMWSTAADLYKSSGISVMSPSENIYYYKLLILNYLTRKSIKTTSEEQLYQEYRELFISKVRGLNNDDIDVQYNLAYVNKFRTETAWDRFDVSEVEKHILPLMPSIQDHAKIKSFDAIMYRLEAHALQLIGSSGIWTSHYAICERMEALKQIKTIPAITQKAALLESLSDYATISSTTDFMRLEYIRTELRELMQYLPEKQKYYIINVDVMNGGTSSNGLNKPKTYAERANEYIAENSPILAKLQNLDELTEEEKAELNSLLSALEAPVYPIRAIKSFSCLISSCITSLSIFTENSLLLSRYSNVSSRNFDT